jgi:Right handed beta helix region
MGILCSLVVLLSQATTLAGDYAPPWASVEPKRIVRVAALPDADDKQNGDALVKAAEGLVPGDRLEIGKGTYSVGRLWDLVATGTADAPIWIIADRNAKVIITRPDARQNVLNVGQSKPVQYLCLRGLEFTGGSHGIRLGQCRNVWIDQCHIHHTQEVCLSANSADTHQLYLTRNTIHDGDGTAEGMYLGGNNGDVIMSESVIAMNHVYNCRGSQGDGIEVKQGSWGNLIAENTVHDCNYPCITVYGTGGKRQNVIERNVCYRSLDSVMQVQGEAIVRNNLLIDGKNAAFASTDHQGKTVNLQVIHNTLVSTSHAFRGGSWNARSDMVLANNVIYSREQNALHFANGHAGVTITGNVLLGDGPKLGSTPGRGLQDFKRLTWDADQRDATPVADAPFQHGVAEYHLPNDLLSQPRNAGSIISGAVVR